MTKRLTDRLPAILAVLFVCAALLPLMCLRDYTPSNELRYITIADESISQGSVFTLSYHGEDYADKPPFYFWLMILCKNLFGGHKLLALAMLSFLPACGIVLVMDKWIQAAAPGTFRPGERAASALMLFTSVYFLGLSIYVRMDMLMCLWIVLSLWTFWKLDHGTGRRNIQKWLLPLFIFLALFTKGPVGLLMPPLAIAVYLAFEKRFKDIPKYLGLRTWGVIAVLSAIWIGLAWMEGGKEYISNLLFHQTVDRAVNAFHHKEPVWYYFVAGLYVFAPWMLACVPCLGMWKSQSGPSSLGDTRKLFIFTVLGTFVMLSLFSSKLALYLEPTVPFLIYLFPLTLAEKGWSRWFGFGLGFVGVLFTIIGAIVIAVGILCLTVPSVPDFIDYPFLKSPLVILAGIAFLLGGIKGLKYLAKKRDGWHKSVISLTAGMLLAVFSISFKMPQINDLTGYGNFCKLIPAEGQIYTLGVRRADNLDIYTGRPAYDFGKDIDSFLFLAPKEGTLVLPVSLLGDSEALLDYLEGQDVQYCGKYAVYTLDKIRGKQKPQTIQINKSKKRGK